MRGQTTVVTVKYSLTSSGSQVPSDSVERLEVTMEHPSVVVTVTAEQAPVTEEQAPVTEEQAPVVVGKSPVAVDASPMAAKDHTAAVEDHTAAVEDHRAAKDHTAAVEDHTVVSVDDSVAVKDHTVAVDVSPVAADAKDPTAAEEEYSEQYLMHMNTHGEDEWCEICSCPNRTEAFLQFALAGMDEPTWSCTPGRRVRWMTVGGYVLVATVVIIVMICGE